MQNSLRMVIKWEFKVKNIVFEENADFSTSIVLERMEDMFVDINISEPQPVIDVHYLH